jgi:hypothetical protein
MHARVFAAALQQNVVTIPGPGQSQRCVDDGAAMSLTPKLRMRYHIFEKAVPLSASQEIGRGDEHAGRNDPGIQGGYEDRDAVVGQRFQPNLFRSRQRLRAGADLGYAKELEQRSKVGRLGKPGIGHLTTEL